MSLTAVTAGRCKSAEWTHHFQCAKASPYDRGHTYLPVCAVALPSHSPAMSSKANPYDRGHPDTDNLPEVCKRSSPTLPAATNSESSPYDPGYTSAYTHGHRCAASLPAGIA